MFELTAEEFAVVMKALDFVTDMDEEDVVGKNKITYTDIRDMVHTLERMEVEGVIQ